MAKLFHRGLTFRFVFWILVGVASVFSAVLGYNGYYSRKLIIKEIERDAFDRAVSAANHLDMFLKSVEKISENVSYYLETGSYDAEGISKLIRTVVEKNDEIYGAAVAFEPYAFLPDERFFAPYFCKKDGKVQFREIPYDYFESDWYRIPKSTNAPAWIEPYFGQAGAIIMSTYSVPLYRRENRERRFVGEVVVDISLSRLQKKIASIKMGDSGYGILISRKGTFVSHPDERFIMKETLFSMAQAAKNPSLVEIGRKMLEGSPGSAQFYDDFTGKKSEIVYVPLSTSGWILGVVFPKKELMADLERLHRRMIAIALAGFMMVMGIIIWIAHSVTRPLRILTQASQDIASGNLDVAFPSISAKDEVGKLASSFAYMQASLKHHIRELTETTAAKERIESEIKIARDIQMGILPKVFPPFPGRSEFDLFATLVPARDVGGDLYDFFFVDDNHLCITIGDVSGKGIPASLFMVITSTLIKIRASGEMHPELVLNRVNQDLAKDNPSLMFVTLFLAILDVRTGELQYCNGGHNPPLLIRSDGHMFPLDAPPAVALGVVEDHAYQSKKIFLKDGDALLLYTDGVTEAMNVHHELFSEKRLKKAVHAMRGAPVKTIVEGLLHRIDTFSKGAPQTDDIAIMLLRYFSKTPRE